MGKRLNVWQLSDCKVEVIERAGRVFALFGNCLDGAWALTTAKSIEDANEWLYACDTRAMAERKLGVK